MIKNTIIIFLLILTTCSFNTKKEKTMIKIKQFVFNAFQVNCFVLYDETKECVIIDASCYDEKEKKEISDFISENNLKPIHLLNTHCHIDHILGNKYISDTYNIVPEAHESDKQFVDSAKDYGSTFGFNVEGPKPIGKFLKDGETIEFGNSKIVTIHVPGHSLGSLCYYSKEDKFVIAGDVLFNGGIGRTDLPGGNYESLITNIKEKLFTLDDETTVFPGHGPKTDIGNEKWSNPFF